MNEVSCRSLVAYFRHARRHQVPPERLADGTGYPLAHLTRPSARIDWSAFARFNANASRIWSIRELEAIGGSFRPPARWLVAAIRRLFFSPRELYREFLRPVGRGPSLVSCMRPSLVELDERSIVIDFELDEGFEYCSEFFHVVRGALSSFPRPLGLPLAEVSLTLTPRGARYVVRAPVGGGALSGLRRALAWPFTVVSSARALKTVNDALVMRQREIEVARAVLAQQAVKLDTAHAISAAVRRGLDVDQTLVEIARGLVEIGGFTSAEATCQLEIAGRIEERAARHGLSVLLPDGISPAAIELAMTSRNGLEMRLRLDLPSDASAQERLALGALAHFLEPALLMAIDNSRAVTALEQQQQLLNQRLYELSRAREVAEKSLRLKSEFVANMSHEIRTPLYGVTGMVQLLEDTHLDAEQKQYVELLKKSGEALLAVVNDVLDFSKIEAGKMRLEVVDFDPVALVEDVVDLFANEAERKGIDLVCETLVDDDQMLRGDPLRLRQIMTNLMGNAIKFTSKGSVQLRLQVDPGDEVSRVRFDVTDTGIGIDHAFAKNIFEPFVQADGSTTRRFGGTGLGLTITKQLCEIMGAHINLESELGKGATFAVELFLPPSPLKRRAVSDSLAQAKAALANLVYADPARQSPTRLDVTVGTNERDAHAATALAGGTNPQDLFTGRRIIIASDRSDSRGAIARTLSPLRADVAVASTLDELMRLLRKSDPESLPLLVIDERLCATPFVAQVKEVGPIPVVLLKLPAGAPASADRALVDTTIGWPVKTSEVAARVGEALRRTAIQVATQSTRKRVVTNPSRLELRLMLVTLDPIARRIAVHLLQRQGAHVESVATWREGIELLKLQPFDALIADPEPAPAEADACREALETARREHGTLLVAFGSGSKATTTTGKFDSPSPSPALAVWDLTLKRPIDERELAEVLSQVRGQVRTKDERLTRVANLGPHA